MLRLDPPILGVSACRNEFELEVLRAVSRRLSDFDCPPDVWLPVEPGFLVLALDVSCSDVDAIHSTYRADFRSERVFLGEDETGQFVTDLSPDDPKVEVHRDNDPDRLAAVAVAWFAARHRHRMQSPESYRAARLNWLPSGASRFRLSLRRLSIVLAIALVLFGLLWLVTSVST